MYLWSGLCPLWTWQAKQFSIHLRDHPSKPYVTNLSVRRKKKKKGLLASNYKFFTWAVTLFHSFLLLLDVPEYGIQDDLLSKWFAEVRLTRLQFLDPSPPSPWKWSDGMPSFSLQETTLITKTIVRYAIAIMLSDLLSTIRRNPSCPTSPLMNWFLSSTSWHRLREAGKLETVLISSDSAFLMSFVSRFPMTLSSSPPFSFVFYLFMV